MLLTIMTMTILFKETTCCSWSNYANYAINWFIYLLTDITPPEMPWMTCAEIITSYVVHQGIAANIELLVVKATIRIRYLLHLEYTAPPKIDPITLHMKYDVMMTDPLSSVVLQMRRISRNAGPSCPFVHPYR